MSSDYELALKLQLEYDREYEQPIKTEDKKKCDGSEHTVIDESLELIDPTPDIHALFRQFDNIYFDSKLENVEVRWSPRMTLCAGLCCYEGHGGLCSIRLSKPLLSLRPRKDLVQTLLHEMIHAFLFVTRNNKDHDAHGPEFHSHMYRINKLSGANITVYHTFHDEVNNFKTHWWQCSGPCKDRRPFFGLVKRSMNRVPGPNDTWWAEHVKTCNGTFVKIKGETETKKKRKRDSTAANSKVKIGGNTNQFVPFTGTGNALSDSKVPAKKASSKTIDTYFSSNRTDKVKSKGQSSSSASPIVIDADDEPVAIPTTSPFNANMVTCPVCSSKVSSVAINDHLDNCLPLPS